MERKAGGARITEEESEGASMNEIDVELMFKFTCYFWFYSAVLLVIATALTTVAKFAFFLLTGKK